MQSTFITLTCQCILRLPLKLVSLLVQTFVSVPFFLKYKLMQLFYNNYIGIKMRDTIHVILMYVIKTNS